MEPELRQLLDKDAIRDVLNRYCRAIDRVDEELLLSCYWEDAQDDHGRFIGPASEFAAYAMTRLPEWEGTVHNLGTCNIELLSADEARCETYVTGYHLLPRVADEVRMLDTILSRFIDRFERRGSQWRIAARLASKFIRYSVPLHETPIDENFVIGVRGREDPAYWGPEDRGLPRG